MLAFIVSQNVTNGHDAQITPPAGWSTLQSYVDGFGNKIAHHCFWKIATSGDAAASNFTFLCNSFEFSNGTPPAYNGTILRITGHNPINPFDGTPSITNTTSTASATGSAITPTFADLLIMALSTDSDGNGQNRSTSAQAIATSNPTWTEVVDTGRASSDGANQSLSVAWANANQAGSTGQGSATMSTSNGNNVLQLIAIKTTETLTASPATQSMASSGIAPASTRQTTVLASTHSIVSSGIAPVVTIAAALWRFANKPITSWIFRSKP